jgi:hypothetical protein
VATAGKIMGTTVHQQEERDVALSHHERLQQKVDPNSSPKVTAAKASTIETPTKIGEKVTLSNS